MQQLRNKGDNRGYPRSKNKQLINRCDKKMSMDQGRSFAEKNISLAFPKDSTIVNGLDRTLFLIHVVFPVFLNNQPNQSLYTLIYAKPIALLQQDDYVTISFRTFLFNERLIEDKRRSTLHLVIDSESLIMTSMHSLKGRNSVLGRFNMEFYRKCFKLPNFLLAV